MYTISVDRNAFDDLVRLQILDLSSNHLFDLPSDICENSPNLMKIYLNNNKLHMKSSNNSGYSMLKNCSQLESISLQNNSVSEMFVDWLSMLTKLQKLDLSHNELTSFKVK